MATRTWLMAGSSFFSCIRRRALGIGLLFGPFVCDQLVEPPDLALGGVEPQLVQLAGVAVDLLTGTGEGAAQALAAFLDAPSAPLEDAHPRLGRGAGEEREVHAEAVVVPGLGTTVGQQLGEPLLALGGDLVDPAASA